MGRIEAYQEFREWHDREFPDGSGNGTGGWFSEGDLHAAFTAGVRYGQEQLPPPVMPTDSGIPPSGIG
jgi:hypothetical protein